MEIGQGWEETVVKQEQSNESQSEMKISLPSMPSLYITSFLFRACAEIHQVGGHVLDKTILQKFALRLLEKVCILTNIFLWIFLANITVLLFFHKFHSLFALFLGLSTIVIYEAILFLFHINYFMGTYYKCYNWCAYEEGWLSI